MTHARVITVRVIVGIVVLARAAGTAFGQDVQPSRPPIPTPPWLEVAGEYRIRVEGVEGARFQAGNDDAYFLSRLRFGATFLPSESWRAVVQVQDAHVFLKNQQPSRPPFQDIVDARLAYVEVGARGDAPIRLRAGRQELSFGEQRLVGTADWLNTGRTFDAVRATYKRPHVSVDGFGGWVVRVVADGPNVPEPGTIFYGVDTVVTGVVPHLTIEPYLFARRAPNQPTELGGRDVIHSATFGTRVVAAIQPFDVSVDVAGQRGGIGSDDIHAWAGHWAVGFTRAHAAWKPRLSGEYNYASGDDKPRDGRRETFDQLYPTGHDKYGLADQIGWKNLHHLGGGVELRPTARLSTAMRYHSWWVASAADAVYDASGAVLVPAAAGSPSRHIGQEVDVQSALVATPRLRVRAGYAHIVAGGLLRAAVNSRSLSYPYLSLTTSF